MLILDKFFFKYERGVKLTPSPSRIENWGYGNILYFLFLKNNYKTKKNYTFSTTVKIKKQPIPIFSFLSNKYKKVIFFSYCLKVFYSYCLKKENMVYLFF